MNAASNSQSKRKKKEQIINQIQNLLVQLSQKELELRDVNNDNDSQVQTQKNLESVKSRAQSYLQTLTGLDFLSRCQNPAPTQPKPQNQPHHAEESNSSIDDYDQKTNTERHFDHLAHEALRNDNQIGSHLIQNYVAHLRSRIGPNDRLSDTESSIPAQSRMAFGGSALHSTVMQIRHGSESPYQQPNGTYY